jgi:hypothetical protein
MGKGITSVEITSLGRTPARTHRSSGKLWLNVDFMGKIPPHYWDFIIAHEEGHIVHNTTCEHKADAHASAAYFMKYPQAPHGSIDALRNVLPMNNREQHERVKKQIERVAAFECSNNGRCETSPYSNFTAPAPPPFFDSSKCMMDCKKAFPHGPVNQKKCIDGCNAQAQQNAELKKLYNEQQLKAQAIQAQLQQAQLQANTLLQPDLASMNYQFQIEKQKLEMPGFTIDRDKVLPIAVGIAVVAILAALLLTSSNSK